MTDSPDAGSYAAGVAIAMASTATSALGLLLQKLAHRKLAVLNAQDDLADEMLRARSSGAGAATVTAAGADAGDLVSPPLAAETGGSSSSATAPAASQSVEPIASAPGSGSSPLAVPPIQPPPSLPVSPSIVPGLILPAPPPPDLESPPPDSSCSLLSAPTSASKGAEEAATAASRLAASPNAASSDPSASAAPAIPRRVRHFWTHPLWLLGLLSLVVHSGLSLAVLNFLGQSRAAAMGSITLLWNAILASCFLGERFTAWDALVTAVILVGAVVSLVFGSSGNAQQPVENLASFCAVLLRPIDWIGGAVVLVVSAVAYFFVRRLAARGAARTPAQVRTECYLRILLAALLTGLTGMLATAVVKSIGGAVDGGGALSIVAAWQFWLTLLALPCSLVLQLGFLNSALRQMDALEIIPPYQASIVIIGLAWGMVFTGDADGMSSVDLGLFVLGCLIACVGVLLLAFKRRMVPRCDAEWRRRGWAAWCRVPPEAGAEAEERRDGEAQQALAVDGGDGAGAEAEASRDGAARHVQAAGGGDEAVALSTEAVDPAAGKTSAALPALAESSRLHERSLIRAVSAAVFATHLHVDEDAGGGDGGVAVGPRSPTAAIAAALGNAAPPRSVSGVSLGRHASVLRSPVSVGGDATLASSLHDLVRAVSTRNMLAALPTGRSAAGAASPRIATSHAGDALGAITAAPARASLRAVVAPAMAGSAAPAGTQLP